MKKFIVLSLLFLSSQFFCGLQAKRDRILPSIKPQTLTEIHLSGEHLTGTSISDEKPEEIPLIEKTNLKVEEAVQIAYQNKPDLKAYQYAIEESRMRSRQAMAGYCPTIVMSGDLSQTRGQSAPTLDVDFTLQQLILNFAGPIEQFKRAKKVTQVIEYQNERDKKNIRHEVEKAFLECWKVQQQNKTIRSFKKSTDSDYKKAEHANRLELTDRNDWLKTTANNAQNLSIIDNYYEGVMISQKKLEFFMGQPVDLEITGIKEIDSRYVNKKFHRVKLDLVWEDNKQDITSKPVDFYYDIAIKNRDELKMADKTIAIAKDDVKLAQRSRLPVINVTLSGGTWRNFTDTLQETVTAPTRQNYQTVSANFSWPLFDGLQSYYQENISHATMLKEVLNKEQVMQAIKFDVERAYFAYIQSQSQLKAKDFDLTRAKNELALKNQQFKIGIISKVELDAAQTDWDRSNYAWLDSKIDLETKKIDLYFACGYGEVNFESTDKLLEDKSQGLETNSSQKLVAKLEPVQS
jgi:outer membrane protein TolC